VPGAYFVFGGASAAVIGVSGKNMVLERVGA
jgi:hypothetical protein